MSHDRNLCVLIVLHFFYKSLSTFTIQLKTALMARIWNFRMFILILLLTKEKENNCHNSQTGFTVYYNHLVCTDVLLYTFQYTYSNNYYVLIINNSVYTAFACYNYSFSIFRYSLLLILSFFFLCSLISVVNFWD